MSDILNITINGLSVAEAMPPVTDPTWAQVVEAGDDYLSVLKVPHTFHIKEEPQPASEGNPFTVQPKLHMLDILVSNNIGFILYNYQPCKSVI